MPGGFGSVGVSFTIWPHADKIYNLEGLGASMGVHSMILPDAEVVYGFGSDEKGNFKLYNGFSIGIPGMGIDSKTGGAAFLDVNFTQILIDGRTEILDGLSKLFGDLAAKEILKILDLQIENAKTYLYEYTGYDKEFDPKELLTHPRDETNLDNTRGRN